MQTSITLEIRAVLLELFSMVDIILCCGTGTAVILSLVRAR
jgi:hypothetical protein